LDFFFEAAFADFFGAFTLPPTKMIMFCSSCETPAMLGRSKIDYQFGWEARRRGAGLPWGKSMMIVLPGAESKSAPELLTPDGRTDIPLMFIGVLLKSGEHDPHAIIECKRVAAGDASLIKDYVVEGVDRFCSGKYGANHSRGFMAGYVMSGSANGVVDAVNAYLAKSNRSSEHLSPKSSTWRSEHPRKNSNKIELHHSMLPV
jgi:hypothetical protein